MIIQFPNNAQDAADPAISLEQLDGMTDSQMEEMRRLTEKLCEARAICSYVIERVTAMRIGVENR